MSDDLSKPWDHPRKCLYCGEEFQPKRIQDADQKFNTANCRKNYFRYGNRDSVRAAVRADLQHEINALKRRVAALELLVKRQNKSTKKLDTKPRVDITLQPSEKHESIQSGA